MIRSSYILLRREKQLKYTECGTISPTKSRTFFLNQISPHTYMYLHTLQQLHMCL